MFFIPYRLDVHSGRIPYLTLLVCALCITVFTLQLRDDQNFEQGLRAYCSQPLEQEVGMTLARLPVEHPGYNICAQIFMAIRLAPAPEQKMRELVAEAEPLGLFASQEEEQQYTLARLKEGYAHFETHVPRALTQELGYDPKQRDLKRMLSSSFSHGSWGHLLGNLLFFYLFASAVELIAGRLLFSAIIGLMAVSTSLAYSISVANASEAVPTIGLSGVVMGMMALMAVLLPKVKVRCFLWLFMVFKIVRVPALLLVGVYVFSDYYQFQAGAQAHTHINYMAHISGAATGAALGLLYWLMRPEYLRGLVGTYEG